MIVSISFFSCEITMLNFEIIGWIPLEKNIAENHYKRCGFGCGFECELECGFGCEFGSIIK